MTKIYKYRDLDVYKKAFKSAIQIYNLSKSFPNEEKYSLTNQMRRSSRSVCANLAEAWRKRKYIAAFRNKLTDSMQEAAETQTWLEFCGACQLITNDIFKQLDFEYEEILKMLNSMEKNAKKFCFKEN